MGANFKHLDTRPFDSKCKINFLTKTGRRSATLDKFGDQFFASFDVEFGECQHAQGQPRAAAGKACGQYFLSDFEQGEIGPALFRHACLMGLVGMVSMYRDRPYRTGRSPHWVKVKSRKHAFSRVQDQSG